MPVMDPWLLCILQCVKMVILQIDFHFQKWMKLWGGKSNEWACSEKLLHWCDQKIPALIVCSDLVIDDTLIFRGKLSGHYSRTVLTVSTWGTSSHCTTQWICKTWCACSWTYSSHDAQPSVLETVDSSSETWLKLLIISIARAPSLINSDDALHIFIWNLSRFEREIYCKFVVQNTVVKTGLPGRDLKILAA